MSVIREEVANVDSKISVKVTGGIAKPRQKPVKK